MENQSGKRLTVGGWIDVLAQAVRNEKPGDRSSKDRAYAVLLTDIERIAAWYKTYCDKAADDA